jgi:hypothetical protein
LRSSRAAALLDLEGVAVQVHRVEHHRLVAKHQPNPLISPDRQRLGLVEGAAVDRPLRAHHPAGQQQLVGAVRPGGGQGPLRVGAEGGHGGQPPVKLTGASVGGGWGARGGPHDAHRPALLALGQRH